LFRNAPWLDPYRPYEHEDSVINKNIITSQLLCVDLPKELLLPPPQALIVLCKASSRSE
jgi:hypothetical protein